MSDTCPGCGASAGEVICCDACWDRVPTNLPGQRRWRSGLKAARQLRDWVRADSIHVAVRSWLADHQQAKL